VTDIDFFDPWQLIALMGLLFLIIFIRYLLVAGGYHFVFYHLFRQQIANRILGTTQPARQQMLREIYWSGLSSLIFAGIGLGSYYLWAQGYTRIYTSLDDYPWWYFLGSIPLALFIQDTYYYWLHRWMHRPRVYRVVHKVHHDSIHTSVFTSFSFHPSETILQAVVLPLLLLVLPLHIYAVLFMLVLMTLSAVINHAGVEIYPQGKLGRWVSYLIIGATHHDQHHRKFRVNYGLYFTLWDRWMGTEAVVAKDRMGEG
jgi:sterol desaturase/sphingolipid hydroxylase (fatty acid hydroxylase superfamily)